MINVALVGCGRISPCHCDAVANNADRFRIAMVCDTDAAKAKALAETLGCGWTDDLRKLDGLGIDLASVLTPSGYHPRHVCALAEQTDIPMILSEKPLALSLREALEVYATVDRTGKRLIPVYQNRYNPIVMRLKELVDAGAFGRIHQFAVKAILTHLTRRTVSAEFLYFNVFPGQIFRVTTVIYHSEGHELVNCVVADVLIVVFAKLFKKLDM